LLHFLHGNKICLKYATLLYLIVWKVYECVVSVSNVYERLDLATNGSAYEKLHVIDV